jgi:hypothetical protein
MSGCRSVLGIEQWKDANHCSHAVISASYEERLLFLAFALRLELKSSPESRSKTYCITSCFDLRTANNLFVLLEMIRALLESRVRLFCTEMCHTLLKSHLVAAE